MGTKARLLAVLAVTTAGLTCAAAGPALAGSATVGTGSAGGLNALAARAAAALPDVQFAAGADVQAAAGAGAQAATQSATQPDASPSPTPAGTGTPAPDPSGAPTFASDFSGQSLDTSVWATCYPWMDEASGCTNFGNSSEQEWYLPSQDQVSNGVLHLVARPVATQGTNAEGDPETYQCRSGMVTTLPGFSFEYGVVQVVARIPSSAGLWPALWLLASNEAWPPEIDMLEEWGPPDPWISETFHPDDYDVVSTEPTTSDLSTGWHTFTLQWTPTGLTWWIDGQEELTTSSDIPAQPMYFLADLADYSMQDTGSCDGSLLIQSVKIWQATDATPTATGTATAAAEPTAGQNS